MTKESVKQSAEYRLEQLKKQNPGIADQINIETIIQGVSQTVTKYKADGSYEVSSPQGKDAGTWKLSEEKKSIVTKSNTSGRENSRIIIHINKGKLPLKLSDTFVAHYESGNEMDK